MADGYDVVVIGSGLGGLAAACRLKNEGARVLVLEKEERPGGTAELFSRGGFSFPKGPMGLSSVGRVEEAFRRLGEEAEVPRTRLSYQVRWPDLALTISRPLAEMPAYFSPLFPTEAAGVRSFFEAMAKIGGLLFKPGNIESKRILAQAARTSAAEFLSRQIKDPRLRRVLGSLGTGKPYSNLCLLAAMWRLMSKEGIWYPTGGMPILSRRLLRLFCEGKDVGSGGGKVRGEAEVVEIRVRGRRVQGVRLTNGEVISAPVVISNADYKGTFLTLVEPEAVPEDFFQAVFNARQTESTLQVALGVDGKKVDLSLFREGQRVIYRPREPRISLRRNGAPPKSRRRAWPLRSWKSAGSGRRPDRSRRRGASSSSAPRRSILTSPSSGLPPAGGWAGIIITRCGWLRCWSGKRKACFRG